RCRLIEQTAQARSAWRDEHRLANRSQDAAVYHWYSKSHPSVGEDELRMHVICAVDDHIVAVAEHGGTRVIHSRARDCHLERRKRGLKSPGGRLHFGLADIANPVPGLAMEIACLDEIRIDDRQPADTRVGKSQRGGATEAAHSNHENPLAAKVAQPSLPSRLK